MAQTICVFCQNWTIFPCVFRLIVHFILSHQIFFFFKVPVVQHSSAMSKTGHVLSILKTSQLVLFFIFKRHFILYGLYCTVFCFVVVFSSTIVEKKVCDPSRINNCAQPQILESNIFAILASLPNMSLNRLLQPLFHIS